VVPQIKQATLFKKVVKRPICGRTHRSAPTSLFKQFKSLCSGARLNDIFEQVCAPGETTWYDMSKKYCDRPFLQWNHDIIILFNVKKALEIKCAIKRSHMFDFN